MIKNIIPASIRTKIKLAIHAGTKYHCPICGYQSKDLYAIGHDLHVLSEKKVVGSGSRKGGCYQCKSTDRDRLVYTYLTEKLKILENKKINILHLAPEKGLSPAIMKMGFENYICGDLYTEGYYYPDYVKNMNVLNIPYEDNYFDIIICNHILEHIPNDLDAMAELYRVLKSKGKAILQVPVSLNSEKTYEDFSITDPLEREKEFGQFDHVRIYGQDYKDRLNSVGFNVERISFFKEFPSYGLAEEEDIFVGVKP